MHPIIERLQLSDRHGLVFDALEACLPWSETLPDIVRRKNKDDKDYDIE
jgi:hypothetical protein